MISYVARAAGSEKVEDICSIDVKERLKKVASLKKKKSSKEMDAAARCGKEKREELLQSAASAVSWPLRSLVFVISSSFLYMNMYPFSFGENAK
jgi:hypothetical protein